MPRGKVWSEEETAILREMVAAGCGLPAIMEKLGRTKPSVRERWRWINLSAEAKGRRLKELNDKRKLRSRYGTGISLYASRVPENVLANREARVAAGPRDLTGAFFGDPPRGFSALERVEEPSWLDRRMAQLQRVPSLAGAPE
jgi:hypothetical protein